MLLQNIEEIKKDEGVLKFACRFHAFPAIPNMLDTHIHKQKPPPPHWNDVNYGILVKTRN